MARGLCVAWRPGARVLALALAGLVGGAGCTASSAASKPKHGTLRMDDLPPPKRPSPPPAPTVPLAAAHAEPDLVDDSPLARVRAAPGPGTHRVEAGETLYRIARAQGTTPALLADLNGIEVGAPLAVGQVLIVPAPTTPESSTADPPASPQRSATAPPRVPREPTPDASGMPPELAAAFEAMGAHPGSGDARNGPEPIRPASEPHRTSGAPSRVEATVLGSLAATSSARAAPAPRAVLRSGTLQWPLRGVLYARFGRKGKTPHDGIDLSAPAGTPVRTAGEGTVLFAGPQQGYGLLVIVEHNRGLVTVYAHNRDLRVRTGQGLRDGQVIATVGESGKTSGPHLHFEVRQDGEPVDPLKLLGPPPAQ